MVAARLRRERLWGLSGLSNCGYERDQLAARRATWGPLLNARHLFDDPDDADAFRQMSDTRVPEHAPFFVYGLWAVPA